ncbi:MAG TPA: TonB family protein [Tepidisphaeraceae bacterium]|jgi:TonB family protein
MTRRDISLTIALCASLVMHALLVGSAAEVFSRQGGHIWMPGFPREPILSALLVPLEDSEDPFHRLGGEGKGEALADSPGETAMVAPKANQTQAFLSLDPEGPGRVGDEPTQSILPLGKPGSAASISPPDDPQQPPQPQPPQQPQQPQQLAMAAPTEQTTPFGLKDSGGDFALPKTATKSQQKTPIPEQPTEGTDPRPQISPKPAAAPSESAQAQATPGAEHSADPAPMADTESDPVSSVGGVEFKRGSTEVRLGRKYKITRPRLSLAGEADLMGKASPFLVLKIKIDETGKVTSADIYRSSGSNEVDQPCKLAAYNWWFEPAKDKAGKPVKDVILFAIRFI